MYLAQRHTDVSLREVAQRLRVRDVSTVSHGEKRITERLRDTRVAKELETILKRTYSLIQALGPFPSRSSAIWACHPVRRRVPRRVELI